MNKGGFSLIEIIFVVAFISILLSMGISITTKFAERRSIDDITYKISSSLNTAKLLAARSGVEFEARLNLSETENDKTLSIITLRGTSNRNTDQDDFIESNRLEIVIGEDYTIVPSNHEFQFNPNGTLGVSQTINIRPVNEDQNITKCGKVTLFRLGRIKTATGNWDGGNCNVIGDRQDVEP